MKFIPFIILSLLVFGANAQDKAALKEVEKEIIAENEAKGKKGGVFSKLKIGKGKKAAAKELEEEKTPMSDSLMLAPDGQKAGKYKPAKTDNVDLEKQGLKDYRKSMDGDKGAVFTDKYGRPINSSPRFDSDKKIKRINKRNRAKLKEKAKKAPKKPSRQRYRYD